MNTKYLNRFEILLIVLFAVIPLFISLPYRINIFLSWEGAYRVSEGHLPFRDFGTPIGGVYWLVPAIFFKIFGAQMISLIKAQVFLNIISGLSFRYILKKLEFNAYARFLALMVFIISFSFINFWPWYNHTVIVYELVALAFLLKHIYAPGGKYSLIAVAAAALFSAMSFLTKQDAGAMGILICGFLLVAAALTDRKWKGLLLYVGALGIFLATYILLTSAPGFGYWFNHGQAPHSSRVHLIDFFEEFFGGSHWLKFYLLLIALLSIPHLQQWKQNIGNKKIIIPLLLTLGILVEALLFSVTSYVPPDNNIFFHSFAVAFILNRLLVLVPTVNNRTGFYVAAVLVLLWWSPNYWRYMQVIVRPFTKASPTTSTENVVDRNTYKISAPDSSIPIHEWKKSELYTLKNITLPAATNEGIERLRNSDLVKSGKKLTVLNMSELTTLAKEIPFELERNPEYPLWFHLGVGMFNKQAELFEGRILKNHYDLVLFERIPSLNNFYPFRVGDTLKQHYQLIDSFPAPRKGETQGVIQVFVKKQPAAIRDSTLQPR